MNDSATKEATRMPVAFIGHGSPMNAIESNPWNCAWRALGASLPTPRAYLCVSAHWYVHGTFVTGNAMPETIYDFGGFPQSLYDVKYPARGNVELAGHIAKCLAAYAAVARTDWGLDHGTWSILAHLRPAADVPVLQLSLDRRATPDVHLEIGRALAPLRDQGVLILGSGNITHNLAHALSRRGSEQPEWATSFDRDVARAVEQRDAGYLVRALTTDAGRMSHPSPDHYLPLLYTMGASLDSDRVSFPVVGFDLGSLSMRSVLFT